jgi:hypothetical protein
LLINSKFGKFSALYETIKREQSNISLVTEEAVMLSKNIEEALNRQINRELYSAYLYLAMSAYFENANMKGFAKWKIGRAHV